MVIVEMKKLGCATVILIYFLLVLPSCGVPASPTTPEPPSSRPAAPTPAESESPVIPPALTPPELSSSPSLTPTPTTTSNVEPEEPVLSDSLKRDCQLTQSPVRGDPESAGLRVGEKAFNFTLRDIYGTEFRLSRLLAEKPVVMVFGSFT